jgi:hypothetical protein
MIFKERHVHIVAFARVMYIVDNSFFLIFNVFFDNKMGGKPLLKRSEMRRKSILHLISLELIL